MPTLNWNSRQLTAGWQPGVKSFFHGLGLSEHGFDKPQVGIGMPLLEGNLCNVHAYELAEQVAAGCREAGLLGFAFGTPAVSDNLTQGLEGGGASLVSRNLIANSAACVITAHCYDAMIGLHHCDKNGPGFAMALARTNFPGFILSGGSIQPGCYLGRDVSSWMFTMCKQKPMQVWYRKRKQKLFGALPAPAPVDAVLPRRSTHGDS